MGRTVRIHISGRQLKKAEKIQTLLKSCDVDAPAVSDIGAVTISDGEAYRRRIRPAIIGLADKMSKGTYSEELALIRFDDIAKEGAKGYESGKFGQGRLPKYVTPCITAHIARDLAAHYNSEIEATAREIKQKGIRKVRQEAGM